VKPANLAEFERWLSDSDGGFERGVGDKGLMVMG
jgi:hypothetical protein